jgi:hypothetical protein
LYCAFIDYRKAVDSINGIALWHKLLQYCIDGNTLSIIHAMYENAKSCLRQGAILSGYFQSNVGVRQGVNLSPVLFSFIPNDFRDDHLISWGGGGLFFVSKNIFGFWWRKKK